MKTMTCNQMGGPCDTPIHGSTPEEMAANGAKHLEEMKDDEAHKAAIQMMEDMKSWPQEQQDKWNADFAAKFAALPED